MQFDVAARPRAGPRSL